MRKALLIPFLLMGCADFQERARTAGGVVIQEKINASVLALDLANAYQCRLARIEALSLRFNTDELRDAWAKMCKSNPALPVTGVPEVTFE